MPPRKKKAEKPAAVVHQPKTSYMLEVPKMAEDMVAKLRQVIISGDLAKLTPEQRDQYYISLADALGVDWRMRPFDYIIFDGKVQLYGKSNLAEQLRKNHKINIGIIDRKQVGDIYIVIARVEMGGRFDEAMGAVSIKGKSETVLANLMMKAETKAKRRGTLSICGAGMLDESEIEDMGPGTDLSDAVKEHLFGPRKEVQPALPIVDAVAHDDKDRQRLEDEAKNRKAKILLTIEKWKKTDEGKDAMSLCLRLGYQSKSQMLEAFEKCQSDFENFYSWLRDEWAKKQGAK